ncbi:MAG: archaeosortase/exosortase family protein [Candidatus Thermoplasmatota archaeon]
MRGWDRLKVLLGLVCLFAALDVLILLSHTPRWLGLPLLALGLWLLAWGFGWQRREEERDDFAASLIRVLTLNGALRPFLPFLGAGVIMAVLAYNLLTQGSIGSNDTVLLLMGAALFAYNLVPSRYLVERDFALLFLFFLILILVLPTTTYALRYGALGEEDTNSPLTYYLLAQPTASLASALGVQTWVREMNLLHFVDAQGHEQAFSIGLSCTGLYSVSIFVSAFLAFVAVEYPRLDRKVALLLSLGILTAWAANILRMTVIVLVGYSYGIQAAVWTHHNIGILIFMAWILPFWGLIFKCLGVPGPRKRREGIPATRTDAVVSGGISPQGCAICGGRFTPEAPSIRCRCGALYHSSCAAHRSCPSCGAPL